MVRPTSLSFAHLRWSRPRLVHSAFPRRWFHDVSQRQKQNLAVRLATANLSRVLGTPLEPLYKHIHEANAMDARCYLETCTTTHSDLKDAARFAVYLYWLEAEDKLVVPCGVPFIFGTWLLGFPYWPLLFPLKWMYESSAYTRRGMNQRQRCLDVLNRKLPQNEQILP